MAKKTKQHRAEQWSLFCYSAVPVFATTILLYHSQQNLFPRREQFVTKGLSEGEDNCNFLSGHPRLHLLQCMTFTSVSLLLPEHVSLPSALLGNFVRGKVEWNATSWAIVEFAAKTALFKSEMFYLIKKQMYLKTYIESNLMKSNFVNTQGKEHLTLLRFSISGCSSNILSSVALENILREK